MSSFRTVSIIVLSSVLLAPFASASRVHQAPTSGQHHSAARRGAGKKKTVSLHTRGAKLHGQQSIDANRCSQIQQALIREHYLSGEASGRWDADTIAAMQKYQADQGWQTKLMPDSRALKKLGLGPDYSNAINSKGASFEAGPHDTITPDQAAAFADAAGVHQ